ncbi:DUF1800 domain-containing protein [Maribacter sp. 2307ULW6-5]|uniref:DUF1800 domain-containing protein n=1 Tax=Maribacter sp. 2307ULW6-5 TaxID=3386275 RepID=UPI0039BD3ED4
MEYFINCNESSLAPYTVSLDQRRAQHLYRRLGFGATPETIAQAVGQDAGTLVDTLVDQALALPVLPPPAWATWTNANYPEDNDAARQLRRQQFEEFKLEYARSLLDNNLRDRLSFFWSNHFVTEYDVYDCNSFLYEYLVCLQRNALGNFRTFVREIGLTSAMLRYLDGAFNNKNRPNENYARELYELFTLGEGIGYTEEDIVQASRALTGYVNRGEVGCTMITFDPTRFDTDAKTIMGRTGNWGYDDVIDILFEERTREIAFFISKKLYKFFVHPDALADQAQPILNGMADTMLANDFEMAPVLRQLFKSEHFFDEEAIGVIIKSPFDFFFNTLKETGFDYTETHVAEMVNYSGQLSQRLFDPYDVAGWQRDREWINTNFIIGRWLTIEGILERFYEADNEQFRRFGLAVTGTLGLTTSNPDLVARPIIDYVLPQGLLNEAEYDKAFAIFRSDVEEVYYEGGDQPIWDLGTWPQAPYQVYLLLQYLARQPEFQLK